MRKFLLFLVVLGGFAVNALAQPQCTPDPQYADSIYGAWPDTVTNFPPAEAGVYYEAVLNFKAPAAVTADLDPTGQFVGSTIQSYNVTDVTGLPAEYTYACNATNCTYAGGDQGCATVYGTTNTTGTYNVEIFIDVTVLVELFPGVPPTPVTQSTSFTGYKIIVGSAGLNSNEMSSLLAAPNPATDRVSVNGLNNILNASEIVLTNIEGKVLAKRVVISDQQDFDVSSLKPGIYLVNVYHSKGVETIRIIKE